ncbi:MAG: DUF3332 domain-containing protein [Muribaculaceae bacterium]|nr:DUF3332 domain-containing protein [Muribaculaceae bacterium]
MRKTKFTVAVVLAMAALLPLESCIGSFALSNKVLTWNKSLGNKFVNELVFFAFWVLPVYEITMLADVLVLNSIEFWTGDNPVTAETKVIDGKDARYLVERDKTGYTITNLNDNSMVRFNFDANDRSWSVENNGVETKFMTFNDDNSVNMITPDGSFTKVELNEQGLMAYRNMVTNGISYAMR